MLTEQEEIFRPRGITFEVDYNAIQQRAGMNLRIMFKKIGDKLSVWTSNGNKFHIAECMLRGMEKLIRRVIKTGFQRVGVFPSH